MWLCSRCSNCPRCSFQSLCPLPFRSSLPAELFAWMLFKSLEWFGLTKHTHSQIQVIVISDFLYHTCWFRSSCPWVQKDYFGAVAWPSSQCSSVSAWQCGERPNTWKWEEKRSRSFLGRDCFFQRITWSPRTGLESHGHYFCLPRGCWSFCSPAFPSHLCFAVHQHPFNVMIKLFLWILCIPDHKIY